jgi:periplasmic protein TonB
LTAGLTRSINIFPPTVTKATFIDPPEQPRRQPTTPIDPIIEHRIFVPHIPTPTTSPTEESTAPRQTTDTPVDPRPIVRTGPVRRAPVEVLPEIDPRRGLSEPLYPAMLIRQGVEGTVILSVQVLENGHVGEVRIDQSSGNRRLDESAVHEARRWKLVPGTRDGVPVVFWKQIPITFRIKDAGPLSKG